MGQKISAPLAKQPYNVVMSEVPQTGGGTVSVQQELSKLGGDYIDVHLININQVILKQTEIKDVVKVQDFRVETPKGFIGEIPHVLRDTIKGSNYKTGFILRVDIPTVRLFNK